MTQHMVAYYKSVANSGTLQALPPVDDPTVFTSGNHLYVPSKYNQLVIAAALAASGAMSRAQFQAPSLRAMWFPEVTPTVVGANFDYPQNFDNMTANPIQLDTNEGLDFYSDGGGTGTAIDVYGIAILGDGKPALQTGKIFSMYATASITLESGAWVNGALTFDQTLPVGTYDIVGMRAVGTDLVAARLVFIGASAVTRPGCLGNSTPNVQGQVEFRNGNNGLYGTFDSTTPPSVDCIGTTGGSAQTFVFDLIQRG